MMKGLRDDSGGYLLEIAFIAPLLILIFLAIAQLGFREFERMVLAKALSEATFSAASASNPGAVRGLFDANMQQAWAGSKLGTDDVRITAHVDAGRRVLHADLVYDMPSIVPIPGDAGWLGAEITLSSEQPIDL